MELQNVFSSIFNVAALHPPTPSLVCGRGLVSLLWEKVPANHELFQNEDILVMEYVVGNCTHSNGSVDNVCCHVIGSYARYTYSHA